MGGFQPGAVAARKASYGDGARLKKLLIQFRETEQVREQMKEAARFDGMTLSDWLRSLAFRRMGQIDELKDREERRSIHP